jgi:hypothetical protein
MDELFNYQPLIDALLEQGYHEDQIPMTIDRIVHDIITAHPNSSLHPIAEAWGLSFDLLVDYLKYRARI